MIARVNLQVTSDAELFTRLRQFVRDIPYGPGRTEYWSSEDLVGRISSVTNLVSFLETASEAICTQQFQEGANVLAVARDMALELEQPELATECLAASFWAELCARKAALPKTK